MKRLLYLIVLFFCACFAPQHLNASGDFAGTVTDSMGHPLSGVLIVATKGNQQRQTTTTNMNGIYSMTNLNPGNFVLIASEPGFQTQAIGARLINHVTTVFDFVLASTVGTITGFVVDESSMGIVGATVEIFQGLTLVATTTTIAMGAYTVTDLAPGFYNVSASATGFQIQSQGANVQADQITEVDFTLMMMPGSISGFVLDNASQPILDGALVQVFNGSTLVDFADTNNLGNYAIMDLPPGYYTVMASADGFQSQNVGANVTSGSPTTVNFTLQLPVGTIHGTVTAESTGSPIPGASISVFQGTTLIASVLTDTSGMYTIAEFAPGDYLVSANANQFQQQIKAGTVNPNETTTIDFALIKPPGMITGTVIDDIGMMGIAGAAINVYSNQLLVATALTDSSGVYIIPNLSPDNYIVTASKATFQTKALGAIVNPGETATVDFTLQLNPGMITGTVLDSGMSPIVGATINVYSNHLLVATALTDSSGSYSITDLSPDNYVVTASKATFQTKALGATVSPGGTTTLDFTLIMPPGMISGKVTDIQTNPIEGATINVYSSQLLVATALTDSSGNYNITNLSTDNYIVTASKATFQTQAVGAMVNAGDTTTVNFTLTMPPGMITGTVIDDIGMMGIGGATINVYSSSQSLVATTLTDSSGNYNITNLSTDNYIVTASKATFQTQALGAMVTAGATTTVNFILMSPTGIITGTVKDGMMNNIEGASVQVFSGQTFIASALTDMVGSYTIPDLAPGEYSVTASAGANYQTASQGATVGTGTTNVDFILQAEPGIITGTVTNEANGTPIPGASILVIYNFTTVNSALTDANGAYSINNLAPGNYTVIANATDFSIAIVGAPVSSNTTTMVNFALKADHGKIFGIVTGPTGPVPGATIQVRNSFVIVATTITDATGKYGFPNLAPGTYVVTASAPNYQRQVKAATISTVTSNQVTIVNFTLMTDSGGITGTVTDGMSAIPDATVAVFQGTTFIDSSLTDINGAYTILNLATEDYTVLALAQGFQADSSPVTVPAGPPITVNFVLMSDPSTITGTVTDECTGAPLPGVIILVLNGSIVESFGLTDSNGIYSIDTVAPGMYTVTATKNNFLIGSATVSISGMPVIVDFSLTPIALPPANIFGCAIINKFISQTEYIHIISWTASPGSCVTGYQIFRNGTQIAFIPSTSQLEYEDHNRHKKADVYSVRAVNSFGQISDALSVAIGNKDKCP